MQLVSAVSVAVAVLLVGVCHHVAFSDVNAAEATLNLHTLTCTCKGGHTSTTSIAKACELPVTSAALTCL